MVKIKQQKHVNIREFRKCKFQAWKGNLKISCSTCTFNEVYG